MITVNLRRIQPFSIFYRPILPQEQVATPVRPARPRLESKALPLQWILDPGKSRSQTDRILAELIRAEAHEPDAWLKADYRQAFIVVSLAAKGNPIPFVESSYICYGLHPDKLWPEIVARRKLQLGKEYYQWYDANDNPLPVVDAAKKPAQLETSPSNKREAA